MVGASAIAGRFDGLDQALDSFAELVDRDPLGVLAVIAVEDPVLSVGRRRDEGADGNAVSGGMGDAQAADVDPRRLWQGWHGR